MGVIRRFSGFSLFLLIVFLNAFTDLGHKILMQNTVFKCYDGPEQIALIAIVNALIILPFVLLFTPAGFLADKFPKNGIVRYGALAAIAITSLMAIAYFEGWFFTAFAMTLLLSIQSAIYSPAKYGYIKELVGNEELGRANGLVQAVTITAILAGMLLFSLMFEAMLARAGITVATPEQAGALLQKVAPLSLLLIAASAIEFLLALRLPKLTETTGQRFDYGSYLRLKSLSSNLQVIGSNRTILLSIVGLTIFWGLSQAVAAAFPAYAKDAAGISNTGSISAILAASGIGIFIGSILSGRISRHYIETGIVPVGALGIAVCVWFLAHATDVATLTALSLGFGIFGGLFIVPLNALIQFHSEQKQLGTILAGNNWAQSLGMLVALAITTLAALNDIDGHGVILLFAGLALIGAVYTVGRLPQSLVRFLISALVQQRYRLQVFGLKHLPAQGGVLLLGNHVSWLDWAVLQMASPRRIRFVMDRGIYEKWFLKWFLDLFSIIPISAGSSKDAIACIGEALNAGECVALFPEGAISRNGHLGEFKKGFERALEGASPGVRVVPFYLRGLWGTAFSRASRFNKAINRPARDVTVAFGPAIAPADATTVSVKQAVTELSIRAWRAYSDTLPDIPTAVIHAARRVGGQLLVADSTGLELSGYRFLAGAALIRRALAPRLQGQNIGLLVPSSGGGTLANIAVLMLGKTLVNLNYTAQPQALKAGMQAAGIRSVVASRKFLGRLGSKGFDPESLLEGMDVIYLEEIGQQLSKRTRLVHYLLARWLPAWLLTLLWVRRVDTDATATILFSSGSEGTPKGVELTHRNLVGNIKQISYILDLQEQDVILGTLPLFHAFGITVTTLLPLVEGFPLATHPDPTDGPGIGALAAQYRATILCGTATFLRLYAANRRIHPLMFDSLRLVIAGAEKLPETVRKSFKERFGKEIVEGYGATETSPVASVNIPDRLIPGEWKVQQGQKPGTVGMPLPGSAFRIVDPATLATLPAGEEGLILIGGNQLMKGYLNDPGKSAEAIVELDGKRWYKSGDKGRLDADGFLTIVDRYSRFAKIGGEMVSLGAVEEEIGRILGDTAEFIAVNVPDARKGEKIVLVLAGETDTAAVHGRLRESISNNLLLPAELLPVAEIPKLGSGKKDFNTAKSMALAAMQGAETD
ncbi:MAG TPA: acyl-[ACP]--phospholipid O-acyltransferase [Mariprofundaceae bacterium]|nr:acyl-[ACP]--phospholipid O-acyltransferase [Mariprofundaceae bacterium]